MSGGGAEPSESDPSPPPGCGRQAARTGLRERPGSEAGGRPSRQAGDDPPVSGRGFAIAYAYLNRRERTEAEVRARLERGEVQDDEIDTVIAELLEFGYLDDARYARVFTQDKRHLEGWGSERISRALRERGVARHLIAMALTEEGGPEPGAGAGAESELGRAVALLEQRFPAGPAEPRDRERAFGVLARKGYESETAADAVREWARRTVP